jgi:hypothetical protein
MLLLALLLPVASATAEPVRTVEDSLVVPAGLDPEIALASVENVARIFELYEPRVPWVPGVRLDLQKEVVSVGAPTVLELPVSGSAVGKPIEERARVTASSEPIDCDGRPGRRILLDFDASTWNIERRIDRIEIVACLEPDSGTGEARVSAVGRMYEGFLPEDPDRDGLMESIGSKAIQGAFLRQVEPILTAVEAHWREL